jgi:hypothetical protein
MKHMVTTAKKWRIGAVHLKKLDDEKVDIAELSAADPDPLKKNYGWLSSKVETERL